MAWKWVDKLRGIEGRVHELSGTEYILARNQIVTGIYSASRQEARRVFAQIGFGVPRLGYTDNRTACTSPVIVRSDGGLKIGCQYFDSSEANKIREWALKE